jgi:hypothetical protein
VIFNERHLRRVLFSHTSTTTTEAAPHLHLIRIAPTLARSNDAEAERSSPSRKSPACITATNVSPPDSPRILAHQWLRGAATPRLRSARSERSISHPRRSLPWFSSRPISLFRYNSTSIPAVAQIRFR